ncbi:Sugar diacid regulator [Virgibacillus salexigens]|uniref:Sugar diacid regulator n=2 Tax=Virgibacillus massiliensis TaxID=1462526 RepID=A0A024QIM0_9BACI|nr:Sugar diacid regulator [Virgibacillus massiliensis]
MEMDSLFQTDRLYQSIVLEINRLIKEQVILTNDQGVIVASTNTERLGIFHEGAFLAMQKKEKMIMTDQLVHQLQGVRHGIVIPIIINDAPLGVLGITGDPQIVEPYAMLVQKVTELFIHDSLTRINQESKMRDIEFFIFDWLNHTIDLTSLDERSNFLQINMYQYHQVIVLKSKETHFNLSYHQLEMVKNIWDYTIEVLFIRWGQDRIVMLIEDIDQYRLSKKINYFLERVEQINGFRLYAGIGRQTSTERLSDSFSQAIKACEHANQQSPVVFESDLRFEMLQHELSSETKHQFVKRTLGKLITDKVLMHTLNSWFEHDMQMQVTADHLHIHKNTLTYRLNRIASWTQLDLKSIDDLMLLYIGFRFSLEE